ncbi:hypothetical protein L6R53_09990 [Myxococcota bacterium]|nr:hypothetical protein [Myxococcota bacterium]
MPDSSTTTVNWQTYYATSTTAVFIPVSPWMSAPEVQYLRAQFELAARMGNFQVQAAYQLANDPRNPDAAVGFGGTKATDGFEDPTDFTDVGTSFKARAVFRFGFLCSNTSGSTLSMGRVAATLLRVNR